MYLYVTDEFVVEFSVGAFGSSPYVHPVKATVPVPCALFIVKFRCFVPE